MLQQEVLGRHWGTRAHWFGVCKWGSRWPCLLWTRGGRWVAELLIALDPYVHRINVGSMFLRSLLFIPHCSCCGGKRASSSWEMELKAQKHGSKAVFVKSWVLSASHILRTVVANTLLLMCCSYVPAEGTREGSELIEVTAQRLQRTSPPLGGHFFLQLFDTVILGKGQSGCVIK